MKTWLTAVVLALFSSSAAAQVEPVVRVDVSPEMVAVGEPVEMRVTVLVPTWFVRPPVYPSFEIANAITRLPPDSSFPTSERVGNETWAGIVRDYRVYPLLGASYELAGQTVKVTYANPGAEPVVVDVEIPEVVFRGAVPAGAETLDPYIAGTHLTIALDVEGDVNDLVAGDAVVLHYRAELDGLPAIFLPPLAPNLQLDGVSIYADTPDVQDGTPARRSEKLTLVFDAGGDFEIPGREIAYWNLNSNSIETAVSTGVVFSVAGPPLQASAGETPRAVSWQWLAALCAVLVLLLVTAWCGIPKMASWYREAAERRRQTERHAFIQLLKALASGDEATAYHALLHWIQGLAPGMDARTFVSAYGDESLSTEFAALSAGIYSEAKTSVDLRRARGKLKMARQRYLDRSEIRQAPSLPPLNP